MPAPYDVLAQLLSPAQADTLDAAGKSAWATASAKLAAVLSEKLELSAINARLVMADEVAGEFESPHVIAPLEITTDQDQSATAYLVLPTALAALVLNSQADDASDEEQQTMVVASTVLGQLHPARQCTGVLGVALGPCPDGGRHGGEHHAQTAREARRTDARARPRRSMPGDRCPSAFLLRDVPGYPRGLAMAGHHGCPGRARHQAEPCRSRSPPKTLTSPNCSKTSPITDRPELVTAGAGDAGQSRRGRWTARTDANRSAPAAQRARFAPLPEPTRQATRSDIDLLAGLQMNVTVELGRTELTVSDVLGLGPGSVIELDRPRGRTRRYPGQRPPYRAWRSRRRGRKLRRPRGRGRPPRLERRARQLNDSLQRNRILWIGVLGRRLFACVAFHLHRGPSNPSAPT